MQVQAYLFFEGQAEEAIEFYGKAVGARVKDLMRYKDAPASSEPSAQCSGPPSGSAEKIMHASLEIGQTTIFISDGHCTGQPKFNGFSLSLSVADGAEAQRRFSSLSEGGQVQMPLMKTFFSPSFGMVTDRFGVLWIVLAAQ